MIQSEVGVPLLDTFLGAPRATAAELDAESIAVLGAPTDATKISRRGAAAGPAAIREATSMFHFAVTRMAGGRVVDLDERRAFRWADGKLADLGDVEVYDDASQTMASISAAIAEVRSTGALSLLLGGDHFVTYPAVTGAAGAASQPIAYLHVDMHLDLAESVPGFGPLACGTPVFRLIEDGVLDPERVAIVGVESFQHRVERDYAVEKGIEIVSARDLRREGIGATLDRLIKGRLGAEGGVYVSIDIDVLNRTAAPGTGNAVGTSGLTPQELAEIAQLVARWPLVGLDVVEVAPRWDPSGRTASIAASIAIEAIHPRLFTEDTW